MIRIRNIKDKIAEHCFSEEEKAVLEYPCGQQRITIADQIQYYYRTACYKYTEEELFKAICILKEENIDLYLQLESFRDYLKMALNPSNYDKMFIRTESNQHNTRSGNLNTDVSKSKTDTDTHSTTGDTSSTASLGISQDATSETNEVCKIEDAWGTKTLNKGTLETAPTVAVTDPKQDIQYTGFALQRAHSEDSTSSKTKEDSDTHELSNTDSSGLGLGVSSSRGGRQATGRSYVLGDQILEMWRTEIPRIRNKYWLIFKGLFTYERDY